jgi:hypothetical protein
VCREDVDTLLAERSRWLSGIDGNGGRRVRALQPVVPAGC